MICIDDKFTPEQIEAIPNRPVEGQEYTIRDTITYTDGRKAYLLNEIRNPLLERFPGFSFEPTFAVERFADLNELIDVGNEILEFEV